MLVFVYVIGGAVHTGTDNYVTYATPGMLLLIVGYCAGTTAVSVNSDLKNGIIARYQPVTPINESIRALLLGGESDSLLLALAWCLALSIAGILASTVLFSKKTK
jgi:ABC-type polysaccharide/polyol phosphate export permease